MELVNDSGDLLRIQNLAGLVLYEHHCNNE